ncbi:hypothetical protein K2173_026064 [Erythroxylum novogranatense]|uniref:SPX domain-containing protein n=1 Tax=Erythroxylum novogranatense TaxID=1862640 RepID=A0AAV8SIS2_9ROSI|nr:hypothetical protein K2173_026064 [Erythroxylum novogranatense]
MFLNSDQNILRKAFNFLSLITLTKRVKAIGGTKEIMKFSKSLNGLVEATLPEWRDKFLSYKDLKKQLKLIYPKEGAKRPRLDGRDYPQVVIDFVRLLENELDKFNSFIIDKEEDSVIKWKELQDRVANAKDSDELMTVGREIVDFHGEMVLLENYSAFNYTGLVKILKKYDKRSGDLVRLPFIQKIMQQPFFSTHVLNKLVKECESTLERLFSSNQPSALPEGTDATAGCDSEVSMDGTGSILKVPEELIEIENMESIYMKQTLSALRVLKEVRSGSSTVNMFSLPPLQTNALRGELEESTVVEQVAK